MNRKVRVKGPGVKLANRWCYINEEAIIDDLEYEKNKQYVDIIEEIKEPEIKLEAPVSNLDEEQNKGTNTNDNVNDEEIDEQDEKIKKLSKMKVTELIEFAKSKNIEIAKGSNKDAIIKTIIEFDNGETNQNPNGE